MKPLQCLLLALSFAGAPPAEEASAKARLGLEGRIAALVSRETALANVRELVSYGPRMGGTASGDRAASAVAEKLRALGLAAEIVEDPPLSVHEESSWEVALGERRLASAWPYGFSPSLPPVTARLAPADPAAPEEAGDLRGTVALTGRPLREVHDALRRAGAIALLTDAPGDPNRFVDWARIGSLHEELGGSAPAIPTFGLSYRDGRLLREALAAARGAGETVSLRVSLSSTVREGRPRTVIGSLAGSGSRKEEIVIVCAHGDSDSGGPGADDNASGVASLIEVARALAGAAAGGLLPESRPEVRFLVWGAEYHSSKAYVLGRSAEMGRIRAVINYDQTGAGAERDAVYYEGNEIPWNERLLRTLESVADDHAAKPGFPAAYTSSPSLGGTDAFVFLPKRHRGLGLTDARIPATTVFTAAWDTPTRVAQTRGWSSRGWLERGDLFVDYSAFYHSSGDTPANTTEAEPWNMEWCARLVALAVYRIMAERGRR